MPIIIQYFHADTEISIRTEHRSGLIHFYNNDYQIFCKPILPHQISNVHYDMIFEQFPTNLCYVTCLVRFLFTYFNTVLLVVHSSTFLLKLFNCATLIFFNFSSGKCCGLNLLLKARKRISAFFLSTDRLQYNLRHYAGTTMKYEKRKF